LIGKIIITKKSKQVSILIIVLLGLLVMWKGTISSMPVNNATKAETDSTYPEKINKANEALLGSFYALGIEIVDDYLYATNDSTLLVLNRANNPGSMGIVYQNTILPITPVEYIESYIVNLYVYDNYAFVILRYRMVDLTYHHEIAVLDISTPNLPNLVHQFYCGNKVDDLEKKGDFLYLLQNYNFVIYDITDITDPVYVGIFFESFIFYRFAIFKNTIYFLFIDNSLQDMLFVCNITDSYNPYLLSYNLTFGYNDYSDVIKISDDYLYALGSDIVIISIDNASKPMIIKDWPFIQHHLFWTRACFTNNRLYTISLVNYVVTFIEFDILDVDQPESPKFVRTLDLDDYCTDICVYGNNIFISSNEQGIIVFNFEEVVSGLNFISLIIIGLLCITYIGRKRRLKVRRKEF